MLTSLHIENLAVVKRAELSLQNGLTVLTGETGAGKSMILDAIHLLLGERGSKEQIRTGESQAIVEGMFEHLSPSLLCELSELGIEPDADGVLYLQRTLDADGKSKVRLNGRPIPLSLQKEIGVRLINIHGQHDSYALLSPTRHKEFLDNYANSQPLLDAYRAQYRTYTDLCEQIKQCQWDEREKERRTSMLKAQIAEIEHAHLKEGEEELLLQKRTQIRNAEKLQKQSRTVYRALYQNEKGTSAYELIAIAQKSLNQLEPYFDRVGDLTARLEVCQSELMDIAVQVQDACGEEYDDPSALLDRIEGRLELLRVLQRKYGADNTAVLQYLVEAQAQLAEMEHQEERLQELSSQREKVEKELTACAKALHDHRVIYGKQLSDAIMYELSFLEMAKVRFDVSILPIEDLSHYTKDGADQIEFTVATNTAEPLRPLSKIASGGELSRIMLAMKCVLAGADGVPTMIFDEIDTGVSGKTSQKVGLKLRQTAENAQVICVTHAAQIAALADTHIFVTKSDVNGRTETALQYLQGEARIEAIATMMGGAVVTDSMRNAAKELLV